MEVVTVPSYAEMSLRAAESVCKAIKNKPDLVLGLPTGATPVGMYRELVAAHGRGHADFAHVRTFNLDEYCGLSPDHPASYQTFMQENLFAHVNLLPWKTHIPSGDAPDLEQECRRYERAIVEAGRLDLAVLGIGQNGHVGFNEPGCSLQASVHVAKLRESTRQLAFDLWREDGESPFATMNEFPTHAITMGMGAILKADRILLLASGASKSRALRLAITGALTPQLPASLLQLHRRVTFIVDSEAARLL
jgi:glucosamine-6-phosphate deaminase